MLAQDRHPHVRGDLDLDLIGTFARLLHRPEDAARGHYAVATLHGRQARLQGLLLLLLRPDEDEVEHAEDEDERRELREAGHRRSSAKRLGIGR
jgi:hypothetical protein